MQTQQALLGMIAGGRDWLKWWTGDFTEEEARSSAGTPANPLAWQLGHIACTQDFIYTLFTGKPGVAPESLQKLCGMSAPDPASTTVYPPLAELWSVLEKTQANIVGLVESSSDADLDRPPLTPHPFFTALGRTVFTVSHNEAYHVGQIGVLRKAMGKKRIA